jgi:hypothetical protein
MKKISELITCHNPDGTDFFPILDVDGGAGGLPKTKKISLASIVSLASKPGVIEDLFKYVSPNVLSQGQSEDAIFLLSKTFALISITANIPGRLRIYKSIQQRELDRNRGNIDPSGNHGVILEVVLTSSLLYIDLLPIVFGSSVEREFPIIFTSLSATPIPLTISLTYLPIKV